MINEAFKSFALSGVRGVEGAVGEGGAEVGAGAGPEPGDRVPRPHRRRVAGPQGLHQRPHQPLHHIR